MPPFTPRDDYRRTLETALEQVGRFKPDLVLVSAGFDAYVHDPIAQETLQAEDFYWLGRRIRELGIPTASLLEGGYSQDLPDLVYLYLLGLSGK